MLLLGCTFLLEIPALLRDADELLPLAPIGGTSIRVVADVDFDYRETVGEVELVSSTGHWIHTQEGRLLNGLGWLPHLDHIEGAHGGGRIHCYYDWGQADPHTTPHWTVQWSSDLSFDDPGRGSATPLIHLATHGDDVLVLYAPPRAFYYRHPGSPDDCQNLDPVVPHLAKGDLAFSLDGVDELRAPDAETSTQTVVQDGIVLLRIPRDRLILGTAKTNTVSLGATDRGHYGAIEWRLSITLTLLSPPEGPD